MDARTHRIIALYKAMPGAPLPPYEAERGYLWGEVDNNEHWRFCEVIVTLLDNNVAKLRTAIREVADEVGKRGLVDLADDLRLAVRDQ